MTRANIYDAILLISIVAMLTGIAMMIVTTVYLNKSTHRFRIFELGYSKESKWYKTGKVDFFTANHVISAMAIAAFRMRGGWRSEKARQLGSPLAPYLHINKNYEKFLQEFPKFAAWEITKLIVIAIAITFGLIVYGIDENWW
jgi:hypothetical protein